VHPQSASPESSKCPACGEVAREAVDRCPECGARMTAATPSEDVVPWLAVPEMRYQNAYVWLVLISFLDILLTFLVLYEWDGQEVNPIAHAIIVQMGFIWAALFKFAIVVLVIIICETVGRRRDRTGRLLSRATVVISALPVAYTFALLLRAGPPVVS